MLVDFGAVRDSLQAEGGSTVVGTFGYMAPEQFQGRAWPATDLYAVAEGSESRLEEEIRDKKSHDEPFRD